MYFLMPPCLEQEIKIETYWNVNDKVRAILGLDKTIKIETYWNVNILIRHLAKSRK